MKLPQRVGEGQGAGHRSVETKEERTNYVRNKGEDQRPRGWGAVDLEKERAGHRAGQQNSKVWP